MNRKITSFVLAALLLLSVTVVTMAFAEPIGQVNCWAQVQYQSGCCGCNNKPYRVRTCCDDGWCSGWSNRCDYGQCCGVWPCCV